MKKRQRSNVGKADCFSILVKMAYNEVLNGNMSSKSDRLIKTMQAKIKIRV